MFSQELQSIVTSGVLICMEPLRPYRLSLLIFTDQWITHKILYVHWMGLTLTMWSHSGGISRWSSRPCRERPGKCWQGTLMNTCGVNLMDAGRWQLLIIFWIRSVNITSSMLSFDNVYIFQFKILFHKIFTLKIKIIDFEISDYTMSDDKSDIKFELSACDYLLAMLINEKKHFFNFFFRDQ